MNEIEKLIGSAQKVLKTNDRGGYTIPTDELYPFQWNWDSAITALGWMKDDEPRAWQEIEMLLKGQWANGMIPHIIFHEEVDSYFPGPDVWGVDQPTKTTSISQPAVLSSVVKMMLESANDQTLAKQQIKHMLPALVNYHLWWYNERDPENTGLVVSYHPWESGMDNSPAWDKSLAAVPPVDWEYKRKDTDLIDADERPKAFEYDRYIYLVEFFKKSNFDAKAIYKNCPYKMHDIGIISILHKATADLIQVCQNILEEDAQSGIDTMTSKGNANHEFTFNRTELLANLDTLKQRHQLTQNNIHQLWHEPLNAFLSQDVLTGEFSEVLTTGTLLALWAEFGDDEQKEKMHTLLQQWLSLKPYSLSSTHPHAKEFEPQRYWRGPIWVHINWLIAMGAQANGFTEVAESIKSSSLALIKDNDYYEYFNCDNGLGCGGGTFSWTAAVSLHWLLYPEAQKK